MMRIQPAPIITIPNVPVTRVMHWIDEGPGGPEHDDELWPTPCATVFRSVNFSGTKGLVADGPDYYPGDWT